MGIRTLAELDLGHILEDSFAGAGWPITLVAPSGASAALVGFSADISQLIDPDTGQTVSGRLATIALRISSITTALPGLDLPYGIAENNSAPWRVTFANIGGASFTFKVVKSMPDRTVGVLSCVLEAYR